MEPAESPELSELLRLPAEAARTAGAWGEQLTRLSDEAYAAVEKHEAGEEELKRRADALARIITRLDLDWLEEAESIAAALGRPAWHILARHVLPTKPFKLPGECTSAVACRNVTATGAMLCLKIRDYGYVPQYHAVRPTGGRKRRAFWFGSNPGSLGTGHGLNAAGLAVANNTGGMVTCRFPDAALNDNLTARLVLERSSSVEEAVENLREWHAMGVLGETSYQRGFILLLADGEKGGIVEVCPDVCACRVTEGGFIKRANHSMLEETEPFVDWEAWNQLPGLSSLLRLRRLDVLLENVKPDAEDFKNFASDRTGGPFSLCNSYEKFTWGTVSASVVDYSSEGTLHYNNGAPDASPWQTFGFKDLFGGAT